MNQQTCAARRRRVHFGAPNAPELWSLVALLLAPVHRLETEMGQGAAWGTAMEAP